MRTNLVLSGWLTITRDRWARQAQIGALRGHVVVWNDGSGGWQLNSYVDGEPRQAYVPGVVTWGEAERCATRWLTRLMTAERVTA